MQIKQNMFDELNEVEKAINLAKYLVEFNNFAEPQRPHWRLYLRLLGKPYTFTVCEIDSVNDWINGLAPLTIP